MMVVGDSGCPELFVAVIDDVLGMEVFFLGKSLFGASELLELLLVLEPEVVEAVADG